MGRKIRVMLVDDHPVVRAGIAALLESSPVATLVAVCDGGHNVVECVRSSQPDVILLDFMLPERDGFEIAQQLHAHGNKARLVMFTAHDNGLVLAQSALGDGFAGYLSKDTAPADLEACLQTVATGGYWMNGPAESVSL